MQVLLMIPLAVQQWTMPMRVSPDTLPGTHAAVCVDDVGDAWVSWYSSNHLFTRHCSRGIWSEVFLVDTAACILPDVTTSSVCKGSYEVPAWIVAWTDSKEHIRLSLCDMMPVAPSWITTRPDSRIVGYSPAVTYDSGGKIWCAWTTAGPVSYYLVTYWDGSYWANPDTLREFVAVEITYTAGIITDTKDNIWVSYNDHESIWVQYWDGASWSRPESIGECFDYAYSTMCSDSSSVWVAWFNSTANMGDGGIFARYHDGVEWSNLIEFPHYFQALGWHNPHADICLDGGGYLWAGWWETFGIYSPNYYILGSTYKGKDWEDIGLVDGSIGTHGGYPSIACGDDKVWVAWEVEWEHWQVFTSYNEITGVEEAMPTSDRSSFIRLQTYPNPFSSETAIRYSLSELTAVSLKVYDLSGRQIRLLVDERESPGLHTVIWDGRDDSGRRVSSGPYFLRLEARAHSSEWTALGTPEYTAMRKLCVVK